MNRTSLSLTLLLLSTAAATAQLPVGNQLASSQPIDVNVAEDIDRYLNPTDWTPELTSENWFAQYDANEEFLSNWLTPRLDVTSLQGMEANLDLGPIFIADNEPRWMESEHLRQVDRSHGSAPVIASAEPPKLADTKKSGNTYTSTLKTDAETSASDPARAYATRYTAIYDDVPTRMRYENEDFLSSPSDISYLELTKTDNEPPQVIAATSTRRARRSAAQRRIAGGALWLLPLAGALGWLGYRAYRREQAKMQLCGDCETTSLPCETCPRVCESRNASEEEVQFEEISAEPEAEQTIPAAATMAEKSDDMELDTFETKQPAFHEQEELEEELQESASNCQAEADCDMELAALDEATSMIAQVKTYRMQTELEEFKNEGRTDQNNTESSGPAESERDDLTRIKGIGAKTQTLLNEFGIRSYRDLAEMNSKELRIKLSNGGNRFHSAKPESWIEQACELAGKTTNG